MDQVSYNKSSALTINLMFKNIQYKIPYDKLFRFLQTGPFDSNHSVTNEY